MAVQRMPFKRLYLSIEGRIPRSTFWLRYALPWILILNLLVVFDVETGYIDPEEGGLGGHSMLFFLVTLVPTIAVGVKRLHDRDRSGLLLILICIPILNLWPLAEMGLLRGTRGKNIYGPDPLERTIPQPYEGPPTA